jgi:hypothetical protein
MTWIFAGGFHHSSAQCNASMTSAIPFLNKAGQMSGKRVREKLIRTGKLREL